MQLCVHCLCACVAASEGRESEVTPWCLGLMANLCRNNLSLQTFVKGKVGFVKCLSHLYVVVCSFFITCALEEYFIPA